VSSGATIQTSCGLLLLECGRVKEAISDLDRAVALAPAWIWPMLNRARASDALGDRGHARGDAGRASTAARRMIEQLLI